MGMKKIIICGAFGIGSTGDEAALDVLVDAIKDFAFVSVFMRNPSPEYEKEHHVKAYRKLEHFSREEAKGRIFRGLNADDDPEIISATINILHAHDLLLLGPGDFINEDCSGFLRGALPEMTVMVWLSQMAGTPYIIYAASARLLEKEYSNHQLTWLLKNASAVMIKDTISFDNIYYLQPLSILYSRLNTLVEKHHVFCLPDPVRCLKPDPLLKAPPSEKPRLILSMRDLSYKGFIVNNKYLKTMRIITDNCKENFDICPVAMYVEPTCKNDRDIMQLMGYGRAFHASPRKLLAYFRGASRALVTRLHAAVFCYLSEVPFLAIAYEDKIRGFCEEVGASWVPLDTNPETMYNKLMEAKALPVVPVTMDPYVRIIKKILKEKE